MYAESPTVLLELIKFKYKLRTKALMFTDVVPSSLNHLYKSTNGCLPLLQLLTTPRSSIIGECSNTNHAKRLSASLGTPLHHTHTHQKKKGQPMRTRNKWYITVGTPPKCISN